MRQNLNNNYGKSITLFVGNKGKLKGNKNHFFHNAYLSALGVQIINNNKEFYKYNTCYYYGKKSYITLGCKKHKYD
jgi:hypothetical protein